MSEEQEAYARFLAEAENEATLRDRLNQAETLLQSKDERIARLTEQIEALRDWSVSANCPRCGLSFDVASNGTISGRAYW